MYLYVMCGMFEFLFLCMLCFVWFCCFSFFFSEGGWHWQLYDITLMPVFFRFMLIDKLQRLCGSINYAPMVSFVRCEREIRNNPQVFVLIRLIDIYFTDVRWLHSNIIVLLCTRLNYNYAVMRYLLLLFFFFFGRQIISRSIYFN